jgi:serine/threonine protein phosphatase 1
MATWVVGDIHGCAHELGRLLAELELGEHDRIVALGDLFHRGPDPLGVVRLLSGVGARFVLGNHEHALLARLAARSEGPGASPPAALTSADLRGDAGRPLCVEPERAGPLLEFLRGPAGYLVESTALAGAGPTADGRAWCAVHAGLTPGLPARSARVEDLVRPARGTRGSFWYEDHGGPELVLFGHLVQAEPLVIARAGRKLAIGLDTGALHGGALTAYSPERDEFRSVRAARAYASR